MHWGVLPETKSLLRGGVPHTGMCSGGGSASHQQRSCNGHGWQNQLPLGLGQAWWHGGMVVVVVQCPLLWAGGTRSVPPGEKGKCGAVHAPGNSARSTDIQYRSSMVWWWWYGMCAWHVSAWWHNGGCNNGGIWGTGGYSPIPGPMAGNGGGGSVALAMAGMQCAWVACMLFSRHNTEC